MSKYYARQTWSWAVSIIERKSNTTITYWNVLSLNLIQINELLSFYNWEDPISFLQEKIDEFYSDKCDFDENTSWSEFKEKKIISEQANLSNLSYAYLKNFEKDISFFDKIKSFLTWLKIINWLDKTQEASKKFLKENWFEVKEQVKWNYWFSFTVVENKERNEVTFSFRWTNDFLDLISNLDMINKEVPKQLISSFWLLKRKMNEYVKDWTKVIFNWHSLWWAIAQLSTFVFPRTTYKTFTFNSYWVSDVVRKVLFKEHQNKNTVSKLIASNYLLFLKRNSYSNNKESISKYIDKIWEKFTRVETEWVWVITEIWSYDWKNIVVNWVKWHSINWILDWISLNNF